jgi:hypothetical protein
MSVFKLHYMSGGQILLMQEAWELPVLAEAGLSLEWATLPTYQ